MTSFPFHIRPEGVGRIEPPLQIGLNARKPHVLQ